MIMVMINMISFIEADLMDDCLVFLLLTNYGVLNNGIIVIVTGQFVTAIKFLLPMYFMFRFPT